MAKKKVAKKAKRVTTMKPREGMNRAKKSGSSLDMDTDQWTIQYIQKSRDEADDAKTERMYQSKANWDMYHLRQDMSHKSIRSSLLLIFSFSTLCL